MDPENVIPCCRCIRTCFYVLNVYLIPKTDNTAVLCSKIQFNH